MNKIVVVLKADSQIGTGHLMRVKGLLPYFKDFELNLVTDSLAKELYPLCTEYKKIYEVKKEYLANIVNALKPKLVLIDHYFLDKAFEEKIYPFSKIAVIDDLANRPHQCHLLLESGILSTPSRYQNLVPKDCILLTGPKYNLIKEAFFDRKEKQPHLRPHVLVNFGGSDPAHACLKATKTIVTAKLYLDFDFEIISGKSNPNHDEIKSLVNEIPQIHLRRHCDAISDLLKDIDLAIGAGGGMSAERIANLIPTLTFAIADNQIGAKKAIEGLNLGIFATLDKLEDPEFIKASLKHLNEHKAEYQLSCQKIYSTSGLPTIANELLKLLVSSQN